MSHNSKHKHKTEDKYSRSNVFGRLGESNTSKEETQWRHHTSKPQKSMKSNLRHEEDYDHSVRKSERWISSSKEHSELTSSKRMKPKMEGYHGEYKQDHYRYERSSRQQIHEDTNTTKKLRSPNELTYDDEYTRARKRKHKSPSPDNLSISPQYSSRHDNKRIRHQSPELDLSFQLDEKHYERGRSRERKNKKIKGSVKAKDVARDSKVSHFRDSHKESSDYGDSSNEFQFKKHRLLEKYEQSKPNKHESKRIDQHKKKHAPEVSPNRGIKAVKKSHYVAHASDTDSSFEDKQRLKSNVEKTTKHYQKHQKVEKDYTSDESVKVSHKKAKSSKVESYFDDEPKSKKKTKSEKEARYSSPRYSKQQIERGIQDKKSKEYYSDDGSFSSRSISPPKHRMKDSKHYKKEEYSDVESDDVVEKKLKVKKKKKQKVVNEIEPIKKKKVKSQKNEDVPLPKKKVVDKLEQEEIKDKSKKLKKKKRPREEPPTSPSDSENEQMLKSRKHHHRTDRGDNDWETVDDIDDSSSRTSKKHSDYEASKPHRGSDERPSHHKRSKLEQIRRDSPEGSSSRSVSRSRNSSLLSTQPHKRAPERSPVRESYSHMNREKKVDMMRNDRHLQDDYINAPRDRHYLEPRERRDKYQMDRPVEDTHYRDSRVEGEKQYFDKKPSRYHHEKPLDPSYEGKPYGDKRNYEPRNHDLRVHEKKMRYEDIHSRDTHRDEYPPESRKSHNYIDERGDARSRYDGRSKPMVHLHDSRPNELKEFRDSRHPNWQLERGRKPRDPNVDFSNGTQRISSWVDDRNGGKLRIETREPQGFRKNHDPRGGRMEERDERIPRMEMRSSRDVRQDMRDMRPVRHDSRNPVHLRQEVREPPREKWPSERPPNENMELRHRGGHHYNRDRSISQDHSGHYSEERTSFYREVRRSGENRHLDLGIEVTIHDDGGRSSVDYDRKLRVSPVRKVSSYETSRSRERPKMHRDRSLSTHRSESGSEALRVERAISPHPSNTTAKYQQRSKESHHQPMHGHPRHDVRDRSRMTEAKPGSASSREGGKLLKHDRLKLGIEHDHSRSSSAGERSRGSSATDRDRPRDGSQTDRGRGRTSQRDSRYSQQRTDKKPSKTEKPHKELSKSSSDSKKTDRSKSSERKEKSSSSKKKIEPEAVDVLDVDWTDLGSPDKKQTSGELQSSSILKRFTPGNILLRMGVSSNLLPPETLEKIKKKCDEESKDHTDVLPLVFDRGLGAINRAESLRQWSWSNAFKSRASFTARLTSYADAKYRREILGITEDLRFPPQPPQIINAKSYSSSVKHYLSKTKLTVGGG